MTNRTAQRKRQQAMGTKGSKGSKGSKGGKRYGKRTATRSRYPVIAIGAVVAVVVVMVGVSAFLREPVADDAERGPSDGATEQVVAAATNVPAAALDAVGAGEGITPPVCDPREHPTGHERRQA